MKFKFLTQSLHVLATTAACAVGPVELRAAGWALVDEYRAAPELGASAGDIGTDYSGTALYSVGSAIVADGTHQAVVRSSKDAGQNWNTVGDCYLEPGWTWAHYRGIGSAQYSPDSDPLGTLFVCGELFDPSLGRGWFVRRSINQGLDWQTVDLPGASALGPSASAGDVKVAPNGDVYAVGTQNGGGRTQWAVRMSSQRGEPGSWRNVNLLGAVGTSEARAVAFNSAGQVFVAGQVAASASKGGGLSSVWTVQRSDNQGATWTTVDAYQEASAQNAGAEGVAVDAAGKICVAGFATAVVKGKTVNYWVVRRSSQGGAAPWTTVDKVTAANGGFLSPTGLASEVSGNVWVCGYAGPSSNPYQWIVRKGTPNNGALVWSVTDAYAATGARPNGITVDAAGSVYDTGRWTDSVKNWWLTRKLP